MTGQVIGQVMPPWTRGQWALRLVVLAGPVLATVAAGLTGDPPGRLGLGVVVAASLGFALFPESPAGTVAFATVLLTWGLGSSPSTPPGVVLAAGALVAAHVAALLASYGPADLPLDRRLTLTWLVRGAALFLVAPVVWLLARALEGQPEPAGLWVTAVAALAVAAVVATTALGPRSRA
ncbi:hypothetical protein NPS01_24440 [Nocardioides psychrotolerans]|uniref:Uncharacterized protein n=1 Tax=Nocardioides psychrotolerans TaxID=1005945 RepID=A0A1I3L885_9ACTN|nr:hypothetical protein [Nocardioides psychrotolerans]GEP38781.1 hypothetical protein NPS01_24440 [Nocardioides psychrotolerans]SFI80954.1 hypothetical protein SAMN05216561_11359 [Nocardioides psychrotolerans]